MNQIPTKRAQLLRWKRPISLAEVILCAISFGIFLTIAVPLVRWAWSEGADFVRWLTL